MFANSDWIVPDWPAPSGVRAVFTTRSGAQMEEGASSPPWNRFNLGDHVGDDAGHVAANRAALRQILKAQPIFLNQVHGVAVASIDAGTPDGTIADGAVSAHRGVSCTVMVADCLPVLFTDTAGSVVGAAHAGWRGLAAGVLEHTASALRALATRTLTADRGPHESIELMAWLGPCIGPASFEVGAEVRQVFVDSDPGASACFVASKTGKYLADLPALARRRLEANGVARIYGNNGSSHWCTVEESSRFFSYRRDQPVSGGTGRMAACIWRI
ncbi:peptidoglycan editing factor PgeF [Ottowia thiooxydans]|uniref:peptidoglycan editing factor PgeF n=1 Tax=Ottowia thiooxydans TaxID=219182 RepID=UPI0004135F5E|nr:peptidoglycan editing factor PgeF [Ottowia thiooxydans]